MTKAPKARSNVRVGVQNRSMRAAAYSQISDGFCDLAKEAAMAGQMADASYFMKMSARWMSLSRRVAWIPETRA